MPNPITPRDCALLLAIPTTRERFMADLVDGRKEYVRRTWDPRVPAEDQWSAYGVVARTVVDVAAAVRELGATVIPDASCGDFIDALGRFQAVTLVAHWSFPPLERDDVLDEPRLRALLASSDLPLHRMLRRELGHAIADYLRDRLNALLEQTRHTLEQAISDEERLRLDRLPPAFVTRLDLEEAFPGCFRQVRPIEFADGMAVAAEILAALPKPLRIELDLTCCNSVVLAERIKRHRPESVVLFNRYPAHPTVRLPLYEAIIHLLHRQPQPFSSAALRVRRALLF
jgi:hypothetical protein